MKTLLINLEPLTGATRTIVSEHIQKELFKLGYDWLCGNNSVNFTSQPSICVEPDKRITYHSRPERASEVDYKFFNHNQVNEFLEAAKKCLFYQFEIKGFVCGVNSDKSLKVNCTTLPAEVVEEIIKKYQEIVKNI